MILTNVETVPGGRIVGVYGMVSGNTVRCKHFGKDFLAGLKNLFGGEIKSYTELMEDSRYEATQRMIEKAKSKGANAIVNVRYTTCAITIGTAEVFAYGTAVKVEKISN